MMTRRDALHSSELATSVVVAILATVLLLILSATNASAQSNGFASAAVSNTALASATPSSTVRPGTVRMTWPKATRALQRGEALQPGDYVLTDTVVVWQWKQPSTDTMTAVAGWITRRAIAQGEFMHGPSIAPSNVIALGSTVKVLWQDGNVRLTLTGTATNNAVIGAPVGVRLDKNRRLDGIAVGPNTVRLR